MAVLCGVDIIEIERIRQSIDREGRAFTERVYTASEISYCEAKRAAKYKSYAARFAAKEAVSKAFGTGISEGLTWKDIEVFNDPSGKPQVNLYGKSRELFECIKGSSLSVSLSHCGNYAVAYAVIQTE